MSSQSKHKEIQAHIATVCRQNAYSTKEEHGGVGWRADVLATKGLAKVAFEVQLAGQSLRRTIERQQRYARDSVTCCWLFERPLPKLSTERPDLPLFYVSQAAAGEFHVSLSGRNEVPLTVFIGEFLGGRIRFCPTARTKVEQSLRLVFFEMKCWKCQTINHIYYSEGTLLAACNAVIEPEEGLWESDHIEYRPEIVAAAKRFLATPAGTHLHLGEIKRRYSRTVNDSYLSFGCYKCDSIFGDWYVMEARMEAVYGLGQVARSEGTIRLAHGIELPIPHWCFSVGGDFCDGSRSD